MLIRTEMRPDLDAPVVTSVDVAQIFADKGLLRARKLCSTLQSGRMLIESCSPDRLVSLSVRPGCQQQFDNAIESAVMSAGRETLLKLPVEDRVQLASTSREEAVLQLFANDKRSHRTRVAVAKNENAPAFVLDQLASDPNAEVRQHVTCNPNSPASALRTAVRSSTLTRDLMDIAVSFSPRCRWTRASLAELAEPLMDPSNMRVGVLPSILLHPNFPLKRLQQLVMQLEASDDITRSQERLLEKIIVSGRLENM